jgi:glycosyltransferase involved in cell wall biosynthesis
LKLDESEGNEKFTVLYSGTLYGKRSPERILSSIETLMNKGLVDRKKIKVKFIGQIGSQYKGLINNFMAKYPDIIEHKDYIPHKESIDELCRANALLLIIDEGKGSEGIYTGKIFEYIRTGKPILGMVPDGVARDLILNTKTGYVSYPSDQAGIENMLYAAYSSFYGKNKCFSPDWNVISKFSRENLTKQLIEVMEHIR